MPGTIPARLESIRPRRHREGTALAALMAVLLLLAFAGAAAAADDDEEEVHPSTWLRLVRMEARLSSVQEMPTPQVAVAKYRIEGGRYSGSLLSVSYDYSSPPVLRSWSLYNSAGHTQIGGGRNELVPGAMERLLRPESSEPVELVEVLLLKADLNQDEEDPRWYFKALVSLAPYGEPDFHFAQPAADETTPFDLRRR